MVRAALLADQRRIGRTPHHGDSIAATLRRVADLTLQQLADRCGLASSTLTTIEAGSIEAFPSLVRHSGEAFLHVMWGQVMLHTEHDAPTVLAPRRQLLFRQQHGARLRLLRRGAAQIHWICSRVVAPLSG
ncbi:helix-turn-helix transcriptional regulator [Kaistia defluvii]|uniref:helix-turn-helix domain-containing protein n=1 Tax=Kaistia defluvii TaxID=410841 RepID=UPI002251DCFC|nr:helix-turn-helix transcriptional regulator [Kaistia defluvii]MCX5520413.1 helix-turn-helix transcriptional regulator [Kaistia defluvii]